MVRLAALDDAWKRLPWSSGAEADNRGGDAGGTREVQDPPMLGTSLRTFPPSFSLLRGPPLAAHAGGPFRIPDPEFSESSPRQ